MSYPLLEPMTEDHLDDAAALLAARHERHLAREPLLDVRFADHEHARAALAAAWVQAGASGAVARRGSALVGYLLGAPKPDDTWGPNVWVESAGTAVEEAEVARDLYGLAAAAWVAQGRTAHYVLVPSHDRAVVDAWFRLGFGRQHTHGVREPAPAPPLPDETTVRRAARSDIEVLARLELVLPQHQGRSPVFSSGHLPTLDEAAADWQESFDDERFVNLVAERNGRVLGSAVGCALALSSLHRGPALLADAGFLGFAAVLPEARGLGLGRALGEAVVEWAGQAGHPSVVTDWRETNLLSSRTWRRLGFRDTFHRLHRVVGH